MLLGKGGYFRLGIGPNFGPLEKGRKSPAGLICVGTVCIVQITQQEHVGKLKELIILMDIRQTSIGLQYFRI